MSDVEPLFMCLWNKGHLVCSPVCPSPSPSFLNEGFHSSAAMLIYFSPSPLSALPTVFDVASSLPLSVNFAFWGI